MKIGIVLSNPPQASETFLNTFIDILKEKHELIIFVSRKAKNIDIKQKEYLKPNVKSVIQIPRFISLLVLNYGKYRSLRRKSCSLKQLIADLPIWTTPNLDYLHFGFGNLVFGREYYGGVMDCKMTLSFRGSDINIFPIWHNKSYALALELADKVQANSKELLSQLKNHYSKIDAKGVIIHPGLQETFRVGLKQIEEFGGIRERNTKVEIVSVGRLHWVKGYELALMALALFKQNGDDFNYTLIGAGVEAEKLVFLIHSLGLNDNVKLVSQKSALEIREIMEQSNLFLQTSWAEGFSNSTLEAQALGLPVVVTPVSGMSTIVEHEKTGFVCEGFSREQVLNGLNWYKSLTKVELGELAKNASVRVYENFSGEILKNNWLAFFSECLTF
jgi:colanic acid/amylovoran biosynthesis glycosyltransferase